MTIERMQRISAARRHAATGSGKRIREAARLTPREIAAVIGVDFTTIIRWEKGESVPQGEKAAQYAEILERLQQFDAEAA